MGCHIGISTGVACLTSISVGVNGGNRDIQVEKSLNGSRRTGKKTNKGSMIGSIAGN